MGQGDGVLHHVIQTCSSGRWRGNTFDITGSVDVTSIVAVGRYISALCERTWPGFDHSRLRAAFTQFERRMYGVDPRYLPLDTPYHDVQHSIDVCVCMARLLAGHDLHAPKHERLGAQRTLFGLVCALFHDAGYLRRTEESHVRHGAQLTGIHVFRSGEVLRDVLSEIDLRLRIATAQEIVHYTGYERPIEQIAVDDAGDRLLGRLLGTADLLAQMADRCYLEKVRDRLYREFLVAGLAGPRSGVCNSPEELLKATPAFVETTFRTRLDGAFAGAYRWIEGVCGGANPYLTSIQRQMRYLNAIAAEDRWSGLRRVPPMLYATLPRRSLPSIHIGSSSMHLVAHRRLDSSE
jgi:hypothetical protein